MVDLGQAVQPDLRPVGVAPSVLSRLLRGNESELKKEFKYTYLQFTYTTVGDTNGYSNISWVWYLGVLTCMVNRLFSP